MLYLKIVKGQIHAPSALLTEREAGWAPEPIWKVWRRENLFPSAFLIISTDISTANNQHLYQHCQPTFLTIHTPNNQHCQQSTSRSELPKTSIPNIYTANNQHWQQLTSLSALPTTSTPNIYTANNQHCQQSTSLSALPTTSTPNNLQCQQPSLLTIYNANNHHS